MLIRFGGHECVKNQEKGGGGGAKIISILYCSNSIVDGTFQMKPKEELNMQEPYDRRSFKC